MTNPSPEKLARLMTQARSAWRQPERRLVESGELAVLRRIWISSRDDVLALQNDYDDARRAVESLEERLPVVRDIALWTADRDAALPLCLFAEALGTSGEEMARELFSGVSRDLLAVVHNKAPLHCPLCERKK